MSRYRKIEVSTWTDEKFRALSPMPACAQGLWFFLLSGPFTGPIPGLFRAGRAAMAEELGWTLEDFDKAFAELAAAGMAQADFKVRLVWLPNALRYNQPDNPNVVRSWRADLAELPDCELKREALETMGASLAQIQAGLPQAWLEARGLEPRKGSSNPSGKAKPKANPIPNVSPNHEPNRSVDGKPEPNTEQSTETGTGTEVHKDKGLAGGLPLPIQNQPFLVAAVTPPTESPPRSTPGQTQDEAWFIGRSVMEATGLTGPWVLDQIVAQARVVLKEFPGDLDGIRDGMANAWMAYLLCARKKKLRHTPMSAKKFYGEGLWRNTAMWGLKNGMKAYEEVLDAVVI